MKQKVLLFFAFLFCASAAVNAQDCDRILLSFFGGDVQKLQDYPAYKKAYRCAESYLSFYTADQAPEGVLVLDISAVKNVVTGEALTNDFVVDLESLSIYDYNFRELRYNNDNYALCFRTPASDKPFLVLRSYAEVCNLVMEWAEKQESKK